MKPSTLLLAIFAPLAVMAAAAPEAEAEAEAIALPAAIAEPVAEPVTEAEPVAAAHDKRWPPPPAKDCLKPCRRTGYKCPKGYVSSIYHLARPHQPVHSLRSTMNLCMNHSRTEPSVGDTMLKVLIYFPTRIIVSPP